MLLLFLVPVFAGSMTFVRENLYLIPAISAYSLVQITLSAFLILALSSLSKSRWFVAVMYAGLAFFTHAVFGVLGAAVDRLGVLVGLDLCESSIRSATCFSACLRGTTRLRSSPRRVIALIIAALGVRAEPPHPRGRGGHVT